jgi:uncharacterized protein YfaQ (DUF2300 family)
MKIAQPIRRFRMAKRGRPLTLGLGFRAKPAETGFTVSDFSGGRATAATTEEALIEVLKTWLANNAITRNSPCEIEVSIKVWPTPQKSIPLGALSGN